TQLGTRSRLPTTTATCTSKRSRCGLWSLASCRRLWERGSQHFSHSDVGRTEHRPEPRPYSAAEPERSCELGRVETHAVISQDKAVPQLSRNSPNSRDE